MAKSKEELSALKSEFDALSGKLRELSDDELRTVAGGSCYDIEYYKNEADVRYIFNVNDPVEVCNWFWIGTVHCHITAVRTVWYETNNTGGPGIYAFNVRGYVDEYYCEQDEDHWYFSNGWVRRDYIQKRELP